MRRSLPLLLSSLLASCTGGSGGPGDFPDSSVDGWIVQEDAASGDAALPPDGSADGSTLLGDASTTDASTADASTADAGPLDASQPGDGGAGDGGAGEARLRGAFVPAATVSSGSGRSLRWNVGAPPPPGASSSSTYRMTFSLARGEP